MSRNSHLLAHASLLACANCRQGSLPQQVPSKLEACMHLAYLAAHGWGTMQYPAGSFRLRDLLGPQVLNRQQEQDGAVLCDGHA